MLRITENNEVYCVEDCFGEVIGMSSLPESAIDMLNQYEAEIMAIWDGAEERINKQFNAAIQNLAA